MKRATVIPAMLLVACCLAATVGASEGPSVIVPAAGSASGVLQYSQEQGTGLRAQSERPSPGRPTQFRVELLVEGDPPFEPNRPIQFAALAEPWGQNLEYRYSFGDGPPTGWLGDSRFPHSYTNPGTYRVYVEVRTKPGLLAATDLWKSNIVRVQVAQKEAAISVNLETLERPPFKVGESLRFAARAEAAGLRLEYQFIFGDGRSSAWMRENTVHYAYKAAGTYQAVVFVRGQSLEGQGAPSATINGRAMLRVVIEPDPVRDSQQAVRLDAHPVEVRPGEEVRLEAHMEPIAEEFEFVFGFGDGEQSERQAAGTTFHRYRNPGTYAAFVRIYRGGRALTESQAVNITVTPGITHRLVLEANTTNPGTKERVRFTWRVEPPAEGVLYLVDFGDSYGGWVSEVSAEHAYRDRGAYRVLLKARIGGKDVQSNEIVVTVKEVVPDWLLIVLVATLAAVGAALLAWLTIARVRNKKQRKVVKAGPGPVGTMVVVHAYKDSGIRSLEFSTPVSQGVEVRFQPAPDSGKQMMEHGVTIRRRKEDSHG
jgi:PKD repeat protein